MWGAVEGCVAKVWGVGWVSAPFEGSLQRGGVRLLLGECRFDWGVSSLGWARSTLRLTAVVYRSGRRCAAVNGDGHLVILRRRKSRPKETT